MTANLTTRPCLHCRTQTTNVFMPTSLGDALPICQSCVDNIACSASKPEWTDAQEHAARQGFAASIVEALDRASSMDDDSDCGCSFLGCEHAILSHALAAAEKRGRERGAREERERLTKIVWKGYESERDFYSKHEADSFAHGRMDAQKDTADFFERMDDATLSAPAPAPAEPARQAQEMMHPTGHCRCFGEGTCAWCKSVDLVAEASERMREIREGRGPRLSRVMRDGDHVWLERAEPTKPAEPEVLTLEEVDRIAPGANVSNSLPGYRRWTVGIRTLIHWSDGRWERCEGAAMFSITITTRADLEAAMAWLRGGSDFPSDGTTAAGTRPAGHAERSPSSEGSHTSQQTGSETPKVEPCPECDGSGCQIVRCSDKDGTWTEHRPCLFCKPEQPTPADPWAFAIENAVSQIQARVERLEDLMQDTREQAVAAWEASHA